MSMAALFLLLTFTLAWYLLALFPSLRELMLKSDVRPLRVISDDGGTAHFARSSLAFISANFPGTILRDQKQRVEGLLDNGTPYTMIPYSEQAVELETVDFGSGTVDRVLIAYAPVRVPSQVAALSTIYSVRELIGGFGTAYRAVYGEADVSLMRNSIVLRWIHSESQLVISEDSRLYGRTSAGRSIRIMPGCTFQRVAAPLIEFGEPTLFEEPTLKSLMAVTIDHLPDRTVSRQITRDSITIPPQSFIGFDFVATGGLRIGAGSWVAGSVKASEDIYIESGVRIDGSIVSNGNIFIGSGCAVRGPVIGESNILIEGPTRIGSAQQLSTVSAPNLYISPGVTVYGSAWAREYGAVERAPAKPQTTTVVRAA
jgi:hypothetical protein